MSAASNQKNGQFDRYRNMLRQDQQDLQDCSQEHLVYPVNPVEKPLILNVCLCVLCASSEAGGEE